jgi:hypothetical protein
MQNKSHAQCPSTYVCRYSDAAFAELESGISIDLGEVGKPVDINQLSVNPAGHTYAITAEANYSIDDYIYYFGRTTGWRAATVIDSCTFTTINTGERIICVGMAQLSTGGDAGLGDSGAPVLYPTTGEEADLIGVLFARSILNPDKFFFASIGNVYYELGVSATWDSCTTGC